MRFKYVYENKKTKERFTFIELETIYRQQFKDYRDFNTWVDNNFKEIYIPLDKANNEWGRQ